ncbi:hypothetical protein VTP01DRAFT_7829 [Rhizomucor pusillus]|uniref:uncharacterized protein n=1 Tax=Rhizomucor pusillus TaxID=4840 RepID=UPI0037423B63
MASSFSYNIIFLIAHELPLSDRYEALCVSRSWYPPCQHALYDHAEISSRDELKKFLAAVKKTADSAYPLGNMVKNLRIGDNVILKQSEFDSLPSLLPNLTCLDIAPKVSVANHPMELNRLSYLNEDQAQGLYIRANTKGSLGRHPSFSRKYH